MKHRVPTTYGYSLCIDFIIMKRGMILMYKQISSLKFKIAEIVLSQIHQTVNLKLFYPKKQKLMYNDASNNVS